MAKGQHEKILQRLYLQTPAAAAAVKKKWHFGTCQGLKVEHFKGSASDADRKISSSQGKRETRKNEVNEMRGENSWPMKSEIADNEMACNICEGLKTWEKKCKIEICEKNSAEVEKLQNTDVTGKHKKIKEMLK